MTLLVPVFFAHQPFRLRPPEERRAAGPRTPGQWQDYYFDEAADREIFLKAAHTCHAPAARRLLELVTAHAGRERPFRLALGLSGTLLEQAQRYAPDLIAQWKALADTGQVEFTGGTYFHSLAGLFDDARIEFRAQAQMHRGAIQSLFRQTPQVFCNSEMLYNDAIAAAVQDLGYQGILTEGVDWLMAGWRSPDFVYRSPSGLPVLLRNYRLSDDIGARFWDRTWDAYPLTAEKYAGWLAGNTAPVVLLALDYAALGERSGADAGLWDFLAALPAQTARHPQLEWATPSQALARLPVSGQVDVPIYSTVSWADGERDTSAWLGNEMQQFCYEEIKRLEPTVRATGNPELLRVWRLMQAGDHLRALSDKAMGDGSVRHYFSAYGTVVEAFVRLHTALYDLKRRAEAIHETA